MKRKKSGQFLFAFFVSFILLVIFYGSILKSPNYVLFSNGDGLKSTYSSYYHLVYDTSYGHTISQNYPFGESAYYTGGQAFIINSLKWLQNFGFDFSGKLIALLNLWMLLSIVIGASVLFLLLRRLKLPVWYSIIVANLIIFLSPQIDRFGGHYNLAYLYFIPLFFLLLHKFYSTPSYLISVGIAGLSFLALGTHPYFFAFFFIAAFFFYIVLWKTRPDLFGSWKLILVHFLIQVIVPFIAFSIITKSNISDRTAFPWGFFESRATLESVFLPIGKPYGKLFSFIHVRWEGIAYVGLVSTLATLFLLYNYFKRQIIGKETGRWLQLSSNLYINALLWASIVALLFSFALPFQMFNLQYLLNYTGPLRQFRAVGRFSWLFYYSINIWTFYSIWNLYTKKKTTAFKFLLIGALAFTAYDAWLNVRHREQQLNNYNELLADTKNKNPENAWVEGIDSDKYQAIMPLPYFHIGSETFWIASTTKTEESAFICSMKTGLPLNAVMLSRTSLSQTMKSLALYFEPLTPFKVLELYNKKPLLVMAQKDEVLTENEKRIIAYSSFITRNSSINFYELPIDSLLKLQKDFSQALIKQQKKCTVELNNGLLSSEYSSDILFSPSVQSRDANGAGSESLIAKKSNLILDTVLGEFTGEYTISFWMNNLDKDLIPRTIINLIKKNREGNFDWVFYHSLFKYVQYINTNGWGLVEFNYQPDFKNQKIQIRLLNELTTSEEYIVNKILIRPANIDVVYSDSNNTYVNNRVVENLE